MVIEVYVLVYGIVIQRIWVISTLHGGPLQYHQYLQRRSWYRCFEAQQHVEKEEEVMNVEKEVEGMWQVFGKILFLSTIDITTLPRL